MTMGKAEAMKAVQESSFVLTELTEYLDTHPGCAGGLAAYQQANAAYNAAAAAYTAQYGPLTVSDAGSDCSWQWVEAPWPWETED